MLCSLWYENWGGDGILAVGHNVICPSVLLNQVHNGTCWNMEVLKSLGDNKFVDKISSYNMRLRTGQDLRIWSKSQDGILTAKKAYDFSRKKYEEWDIHKHVWNPKLPLKISIFFWKLWHNALKLDSDVQKFGISLASKCACCVKTNCDQIDHLMGDSELANEVWKYFSNAFGYSQRMSKNWRMIVKEWCRKFKSKDQFDESARLIPFLIYWEIWLNKLKFKHEGAKMSAQSIIEKVKKWIKEISPLLKPTVTLCPFKLITLETLNVTISHVLNKRPISVKWAFPPTGRLKLNTDGSALGNLGVAGCGGIVRNDHGELVFAYSQFLNQGTNTLAEVYGVLTGLLACYQLGCHNIVVETDSQILVNWWQGKTKPNVCYLNEWDDILLLMDVIGTDIIHTYREGNSVADFLAKNGANGISACYYELQNLPKKAIQCLLADSIGIANIRT